MTPEQQQSARAELARAMGWTERVDEWKGTIWFDPTGQRSVKPNPFTSAEDSRALVAWLSTQAKMHGRFCRNLLAALDLEIEGEYYWRIVDELLNAPLPVIAEAAWKAITGGQSAAAHSMESSSSYLRKKV